MTCEHNLPSSPSLGSKHCTACRCKVSDSYQYSSCFWADANSRVLHSFEDRTRIPHDRIYASQLIKYRCKKAKPRSSPILVIKQSIQKINFCFLWILSRLFDRAQNFLWVFIFIVNFLDHNQSFIFLPLAEMVLYGIVL